MKTPITLAAAALLLLFGACADDAPTGPAVDDTGTVALGITTDDVALSSAFFASADSDTVDVPDVPELSSLVLTFDALRLYPGPGSAIRGGFGVMGHDDQGEWIEILLDAPVTVDVFDLESGLVDLIASAEIPSGDYRGIGLHLVEAVATTTDGEEFTVVLPSDHFEVLRVMARFTVEAGAVEGLTLTIDLQSTLNACDLRDGELVLRPVLGNLGMNEDPREWRGWDGEHGPHGPGTPPDGPGGDGEGDGDGDGDCDGDPLGDGPHGPGGRA